MRNAAGAIQGVPVSSDLRAAGEAGGYITQIDMHADGTKLFAGDTLQPMWCDNTDPVWKQVFVGSKKPAGYDARSTANGNSGKRDQDGSTGAAIAPSNSSIWYFCICAVIFKATGKGATLTMSPQTSYTSRGNSGPPRIAGPYLVVHPTDPSRVMWGVQEGVVFSTDGFATDKALTASVPATTISGTGSRMVLVGFDPSNTAVAYAHSWGNGLYKCTNALAASPTFTLVAGSPTTARRMRVGANGKVWMTDQSGALWTCTGTTISQNTTIKTDNWHDIAIDPANTQRIVVMNEVAEATISNDGGATWVGNDKIGPTYPSPIGIYINARDVPYIGNYASGFDVGGILFDPSATNKLYSTYGLGILWTNPPSTFTRMDWYTQVRGIRQLIPYSAISPPSGKPMWSNQDRPIFILRDNLDQSAINYGPRTALTDYSPGINHGWHLTYSPQDPTYIVALVNFDGNGGGAANNLSGASSDGGATFTRFPNPPYATFQGGGHMAVSANKDQILCFPGDNIPACYTLNRGATAWSQLSIPGIPAGTYSGQSNYYFQRQSCCADSVTPGTFLFYHPGTSSANAGFFRITGGLTNAPTRLSTGYAFAGSGGSGGNCRIEGFPGRAGCYLFAGDSDFQGLPLRRTADAGATWADIAAITNCTSFSFGAAAPGSTFATCWVIGTYAGVYGIHYSTDDLATWKTFATNLADEWAGLTYVCADRNEFGLIYVSVSGKAWVYSRLTDRKLIV